MKEDARLRLIDLCSKARQGSLTERQLDNLWPHDEPRNSFIDVVGEDLLEALVHFPVGLFSRVPDWSAWHRSEMHNLVMLDEILLNEPLSDEDRLWHRDRLEDAVENLSLDETELRAWIERKIRDIHNT